MRKACFSLFCILSLSIHLPFCSQAQVPDSIIFLSQVKQLDEFMLRFNNEQYIPTNQQKSEALLNREKADTNEFFKARVQALQTLFNITDKTLMNNPLRNDFIQDVCNPSNHTELNYSDSCWYAVVNCRFKLKNTIKNLDITLVKKGNTDSGYWWQIAGVDPQIKSLIDYKENHDFISALNHEMSFMDLYKVFKNANSFFEYTDLPNSEDDLFVFSQAVSTKKILFERVNSTKFYFLQVSNWLFTVEYFNRRNLNSGWLISGIKQISNADKKSFTEQELHLKTYN
jgi:hypothetical protein